MRAFLFCTLLFASSFATAQYRHFDNIEMQLGFKNQKADQGRFGFVYTDDTINVQREKEYGAPDMQALIGIGAEFELKNNFYLGVKGEFNITNVSGWGLQLGAGYRLKLNYFMRLQPELLVSWATIVDTIGLVSYSPSQLKLNDITFWPNSELWGFYRAHQYGIQPKLTLVADFAERFEFRYTMMYQMNFIYNQAVQLRGEISPEQNVRTTLPFRSELMTTTLDGEPLEKPIFRPSGFTVRVGFAYKLPLNRR